MEQINECYELFKKDISDYITKTKSLMIKLNVVIKENSSELHNNKDEVQKLSLALRELTLTIIKLQGLYNIVDMKPSKLDSYIREFIL